MRFLLLCFFSKSYLILEFDLIKIKIVDKGKSSCCKYSWTNEKSVWKKKLKSMPCFSLRHRWFPWKKALRCQSSIKRVSVCANNFGSHNLTAETFAGCVQLWNKIDSSVNHAKLGHNLSWRVAKSNHMYCWLKNNPDKTDGMDIFCKND